MDEEGYIYGGEMVLMVAVTVVERLMVVILVIVVAEVAMVVEGW